MVGSVWCGLLVVSNSDLQSQTIIALCQPCSLFSQSKAASSAVFPAEKAFIPLGFEPVRFE